MLSGWADSILSAAFDGTVLRAGPDSIDFAAVGGDFRKEVIQKGPALPRTIHLLRDLA